MQKEHWYTKTAKACKESLALQQSTGVQGQHWLWERQDWHRQRALAYIKSTGTDRDSISIHRKHWHVNEEHFHQRVLH